MTLGTTLTFRSFLQGPPRYTAATPWKAYQAIAVGALIQIAASVLSLVVLQPLTGINIRSLPDLRPVWTGTEVLSATGAKALIALLLISQVWTVGMTLLACRRGGIAQVLRLAAPEGGWRPFVFAVLAMIPILAVITLFGNLADPESMARDFNYARAIANTDAVVATTLAIGVGASLSEECLFRGFLLSALSQTRIGYWPAAILVAAAWTALHWGYSWIGLLDVFVLGLYFSWLLRRTGSLWPLLFCHALYNTSLLVVMRYWPD